MKYDRMPMHPAHSLRMLLLVCTCPLHSGQTRQANDVRSNVCHNEEIAADVRQKKEEAGCHYFRRGTATGLAQISAPSFVIKGIGIWGSDAYLGYIDATESGSMERAMSAMAEADPKGALGPRGIAR